MAIQAIDVLIIGGGITGAGCALELSRAGYSVILVEKGDFASGTSSKTTKLIHGGLRYLKTGDLRQVRIGLKARAELLRIAPELVKPIRIQIPYRNIAERAYLEAGLSLYKLLGWPENSLPKNTPDPRLLSPLEPSRARAKGFLSFWDAQTDDTALVFSVLLAAGDFGAEVHNYTDIVSVTRETNGFVVALDDHRLEKQFEVRSRAIVNAAGVWSPNVNAPLGLQNAGPSIRMSKGIHVVTTLERFPLQAGLLIPNDDGRPIFALPWLGHVLIGTTDTEYSGDPDRVLVEMAEVEYLLRAVNSLLPELRLASDDLTGHFAGVRPLVSGRKSRSTAELSRRHAVVRTGCVVSATGGKLTTFRAISRDVLHCLSPVLGPRTRPEKALSLRHPFPQGVCEKGDELWPGAGLGWNQLFRLAKDANVYHLDDLAERRSQMLVLNRAATLTHLGLVSQGLAQSLGWSSARVRAEAARLSSLPEAIPPAPGDG